MIYNNIDFLFSTDCNMACQYCYIKKDKKEMSAYNLKTREKNAAVSSDFDKYFRNQFRNKSLTKEAKGINDITADSLNQIYHNMATKEELTALIKNSTLKKGGDEGRLCPHRPWTYPRGKPL